MGGGQQQRALSPYALPPAAARDIPHHQRPSTVLLRLRLRHSITDAGPGEVVTIPAGRFHTFRNASDREGLVLEFGLDPPAAGNGDERFFRNTQTYRDDCRRAGIPRSLAQVLLFNYHGGVVLTLPGPRVLARPLGSLLNFFGGVVLGKWVFGFKASYDEYYCDDGGGLSDGRKQE